MKNIVIITAVFLILAASPLFGQFEKINPGELPSHLGSQIRLRTESKASFQGTLYSAGDEFVAIIDRDGQIITLLSSAVTEVWVVDPGLDKRSFYQDSASNRLLVIPTGFPMETGEFHIADQEIAAVTMSYGVNSSFSVWGGISIPGALVSARGILSTGEHSAVSFGSFAGLSWIEFTGLLIPYAIYSVGSPENNFTAGAGAVFGFDDTSFDIDAAVLVLGGKTVLSDSTALVFENWIIWGRMNSYPAALPEDREPTEEEIEAHQPAEAWNAVPIIGVPGIAFRIAGAKFSWDIGAVLPLLVSIEENKYRVEGIGGETGFIPIPLISLTYRID